MRRRNRRPSPVATTVVVAKAAAMAAAAYHDAAPLGDAYDPRAVFELASRAAARVFNTTEMVGPFGPEVFRLRSAMLGQYGAGQLAAILAATNHAAWACDAERGLTVACD